VSLDWTSNARPFAEATLHDRCVVRRGGGEQVYDPETQSYTTAPGSVVYRGPCRTRPMGGGDQDERTPGQVVSQRRYVMTLPLAAAGLRVDDVVQHTSSRDPDLLTLRLRVTEPQANSSAMFRRLVCEADFG